MTPNIVRADYPALETAARQFAEEERRIRTVLTSVEDQLRILRGGGWDADAASALCGEMERDVCPGIARLATSLGQAAATTRAIARLFRQAEEEAAACLGAADEAEGPLPLKQGNVLLRREAVGDPPEQDVGGSPVTDLSGIQPIHLTGTSPNPASLLSFTFADPDFPIPVPTWGDYDAVDLQSIPAFLNSGICTQDCIIIAPDAYPFILQSQQMSEEEARQARRNAQGDECEGANPDDPWNVALYSQNRPRHRYGYTGWQAHHGVNDQWMENLFNRVRALFNQSTSVYRSSDAPALLMPYRPYHRETVIYFNQSGFNPNHATWLEARALADAQFGVSRTSDDCQEKYWRRFKEYTRSIICQLIVEGIVYNQLPADVRSLWQFVSDAGADPTEAVCSGSSPASGDSFSA